MFFYFAMQQHDYPTGTLLKILVQRMPNVYHYGIVLNEGNGMFIVHNTPYRLNEHGGNVLIDDLNAFAGSCPIIEVKKTNLNAKIITAHIDRHKYDRFNFVFWNCEHFIFSLTRGRRYSPQLMSWINNLLLFAMIAAMIIKVQSSKKD
jgi:hypothetical protein